MLQSSGKGNALVKESFYARKAFFIDSGVGTSLVSEGEGEERDKADLAMCEWYLGQCSSTKSARVRSNCAGIVGQVAHCRFPWAVEFRHTSCLLNGSSEVSLFLSYFVMHSVPLYLYISGHLKPYGSLTLGYRERFSRSATSYLSPLNLLTARSRRLIFSIRGSDGCGGTYGTI